MNFVASPQPIPERRKPPERCAARSGGWNEIVARSGGIWPEPLWTNIMHQVRLIHWNVAEGEERAARLSDAGFEVAYDAFDGPQILRAAREDPPAAVVIDLSRLPMQGRDVGIALRGYQGMRSVPLVFVAGAAEKVARVRESLPDAIYTTWEEIGSVLSEAIAHPPAVTVIPQSRLAGYSGTPLVKKLGIAANAVVALVDAPDDFESLLGNLPEGATLRRQSRGPRNVTIWFTRTCKDLERGIERMARVAEQGPLWIVWPKQASELRSDVTETIVRKTGLAAGLVDYKVCAVDATWSGLLFARRKAK